MGTKREFQDMLNDYLPNKLLKEELLKRSWLLNNITRDDSWGGGAIIVPFRANKPASVSVNKLTAANNIHQSKPVRGQIAGYQEQWHSMIINHRDLVDHEGRIPEDTFLKVITEETEGAMEYMKLALNTLLLNGASFASVTDATNAATGVMVVDKIDLFELGQEVVLDDDDSAAATYFVIAINLDASSVTLSATRGGAAANVSAYSVAQNAKFYYPGAEVGSFQSLRGALLSAANGGDANLHGVSKLLYPFLQAINVDGGVAPGLDIDETNLLDALFDAMSIVQQKARGGKISVALMSLKHSATVLKLVQSEKGSFHIAPNSLKVTEFGWTEVMIGSPNGNLVRVVGVQEMQDDVIFLLDPKSMTFRSKGFIRKHKTPEGIEFYVERDAADGYQYICDMFVFGELEVTKPGNNGIIYGIDY